MIDFLLDHKMRLKVSFIFINYIHVLPILTLPGLPPDLILHVMQHIVMYEWCP